MNIPHFTLHEASEALEDYENISTNVEKVRCAQSLINAAIQILKEVAKDTNDRNAEAYVVDHLKVLASSNHGFLSGDMNLDKWIERLEGDDDEDDEDEDE
jgi:hypothetical protein